MWRSWSSRKGVARGVWKAAPYLQEQGCCVEECGGRDVGRVKRMDLDQEVDPEPRITQDVCEEGWAGVGWGPGEGCPRHRGGCTMAAGGGRCVVCVVCTKPTPQNSHSLYLECR